jgi:hypothetical protein
MEFYTVKSNYHLLFTQVSVKIDKSDGEFTGRSICVSACISRSRPIYRNEKYLKHKLQK